jgi:hypothetical protein
MLTDDIAHAQGMHSDSPADSFARLALTTVVCHVFQANPAGCCRALRQE